PQWLIDELDRVERQRDEAKSRNGKQVANDIPKSVRNNSLTSIAGTMRRIGMSFEEIEAALQVVNSDRCKPPLSKKEVSKIAQSIAGYEPDQVATATAEHHFEQDGEIVQSDQPGDPGPLPEHLL